MKNIILILLLTQTTYAIPTRLDFSGIVTEADLISESHGFGVGHQFSGSLFYDADGWINGTPIGNPGSPRVGIWDSIWLTSGNFNNFNSITIGPDSVNVGFIGECSLLNFLNVNINHSFTGDTTTGWISAICSREAFSFGNWTGEIFTPRIHIASVPEGGATVSMLGLAVGALFAMGYPSKKCQR